MHASEGPGSGEDTFAFTAAGSKETQQDLIENIYLTVLLTAVFFPFSFVGLRLWILAVGFFFFFYYYFLLGFSSLFGCELKAINS